MSSTHSRNQTYNSQRGRNHSRQNAPFGNQQNHRSNNNRQNGYTRANQNNNSMNMGMQGFQNAISQLNQINQMMMQNQNSNPMDLLNQFFYQNPK